MKNRAGRKSRTAGKLRRKVHPSHGEGRRFNPYHSNHSISRNNLENTQESPVFRGLPFSTLPYRDLLDFEDLDGSGCEPGVNGRRNKRGAA